MSRLDIRLGVNSHDLEIGEESFDLSLVGDTDLTEYTAQKLKIRLWFFLGEWFLDTAEGTPFYQEILVKNPRVPRIETLLKARILESPNIESLESFASEYDNARRRFDVQFEAKTTEGEPITFEGSIP